MHTIWHIIYAYSSEVIQILPTKEDPEAKRSGRILGKEAAIVREVNTKKNPKPLNCEI